MGLVATLVYLIVQRTPTPPLRDPEPARDLADIELAAPTIDPGGRVRSFEWRPIATATGYVMELRRDDGVRINPEP